MQTKPFESTVQLSNGMQLIKNAKYLANIVNDIYFTTQIDAYSENTPKRGEYFDQVCEILSQWFKNEHKNVLLHFDIESASDKFTDFKYSQQLADCLYNKICDDDDKNNANADEDMTPLAKGKFVAPYYGGVDSHFDNTVIINDRIAIGIHMDDKSRAFSNGPVTMQLIVQVIAKGAVFDLQMLTQCVCYHDDEDDRQDWYSDNYWYDDRDDWGSQEDVNVFDDDRINQQTELEISNDECSLSMLDSI